MHVISVTKAQDVPKKMIDDKPTLVYWHIVGLAHHVRLLLMYCQVDFVDVRIDALEADDPQHRVAWKSVKPSMSKEGILYFPNLPYFMDYNKEKDGAVVNLSQSETILRYLGRKYDMMGPIDKQHLVDLAMDQLVDCENKVFDLTYDEGNEALVVWFKESLPTSLEQWEKFLGDKDYVAGDVLTIVDFKLYVHLSKLVIIHTELVAPDMPDFMPENLDRFLKRMEGLPKFKAALEHPEYFTRPLGNPNSIFK